ncbi:MAG: hypothetical protein H0U71_03735 [Gammaproteobacteria bacterium]|nr:hypothetical protein [Gammaproteobacteria bacterium]
MRYIASLMKYVAIVFVFSSLSACSKNKSAEYFITHPEEIQPTYERCVSLNNVTEIQKSNECVAVLEAIPKFKANLSEILNNTGIFGLNLMRAEIKLVNLQNAHALALKESAPLKKLHDLEAEIQLQKIEIKSRLATIRLLFKLRS